MVVVDNKILLLEWCSCPEASTCRFLVSNNHCTPNKKICTQCQRKPLQTNEVSVLCFHLRRYKVRERREIVFVQIIVKKKLNFQKKS